MVGITTPTTSSNKSHLWLCSPLSRMGQRHRVTIKDEGDGYNLRAEVKGRASMVSTTSKGGEGEESIISIEVRGKKEEDF